MQGAEERGVRRIQPYAATRSERPARLGQVGNAADGAFLVDQGHKSGLTSPPPGSNHEDSNYQEVLR